MSNASLSPVQRALTARRAFFQQGEIMAGMMDDAIYRSWTRCAATARGERDRIEFQPLDRGALADMLERNAPLLLAAREPLEQLARAVAGAGYAVLLTDAQGRALRAACPAPHATPPMRQAFRPGVDLSESIIGTSAMGCALNERRPVRVFGPEHYFAANHVFHCAAAPVVAPDGQVLGCLDITRDSPQPDLGALALVQRCARATERDLFRLLNAFLTIDLSWRPDRGDDRRDLILAFGADGEILGLSEGARRFAGDAEANRSCFEDIFEGRFGDQADRLRHAAAPMPLRLRSGLSLFARRADFSTPRPAAAGSTGTPPPPPPLPEFGSPDIHRRIEQAGKALAHDLPILLVGETGVGKDVLARVLHERGSQGHGPFIAINCAAIPESLIEGELFGHAEGAFTGARRGGGAGLIEQADGGTLFLDEIGDMPPHLQSRLLRVLENKEVARLGAAKARKISFRLICATLRPLERLTGAGGFREDLFYRIDGYRIVVPPLRDRPALPALIALLLAEISDGTRALDPEALALLARQRWPGNTRELKHRLIRAHCLAEAGRPLGTADFPEFPPSPRALSEELRPGLLPGLEQRTIRQALSATGQDVTAAARLLGISRATLYRRLKSERPETERCRAEG
jgi:sigma-54 dependent transcriptional regulator, acetoin dehydrogenase operon transcriptional activator AcoR